VSSPAPAGGGTAWFPVADPQFWVATGVFVLALLWLARGLPPMSRLGRRRGRGGRARATLTVSGKPLK